MLGCRSSGLRPTPSAGTGPIVWSNGDSRNTSSAAKNAPSPSSTAVAYGAISRSRRRVKYRIRLDHSARSVSHSSSEPSCDDHTAVAR
jgi:hypothetical protein